MRALSLRNRNGQGDKAQGFEQDVCKAEANEESWPFYRNYGRIPKTTATSRAQSDMARFCLVHHHPLSARLGPRRFGFQTCLLTDRIFAGTAIWILEILSERAT